MSVQEISRVLGKYLGYFSAILLVPFFVALFFEYISSDSHPQANCALAFLATLIISLILSFLFQYLGRGSQGSLNRKESIVLVPLIWLLTSLLGGLPFLFSGTLKSPLDACFESMSGFTTTGASIFYPKAYDPVTLEEIPITIQSSKDPAFSYTFYGTVEPIRDPSTNQVLFEGVEAIGKGLLFWRCFMQWLGGMGIVVLFIAVLPDLSLSGKFLFEAEMPGPNKEGITPRIKETASLLWKIYLGLTLLEIILLLLSDSSITFFDALTLSLSTISTGGFSIKNENMAAYPSLSTQWVIMLFMVLGSLNFVFYFHFLKRKISKIFEPELFAYLFTLLAGCLWTTFILYKSSSSFFEALHQGSFHAISAQTSTGFTISNLDLWPFSAQIFLLFLFYIGGMSGSTSGGIKMARHYILFKALGMKLESLFRPSVVRSMIIGNKEISDKTISTTLVFFCLLILCSVLGTYFFILDGIDPITSFGIVSSLTNNAGISIGDGAASQSCAFLPPFSKCISFFWMLLGRLEYFALFILFVPSFWRGSEAHSFWPKIYKQSE